MAHSKLYALLVCVSFSIISVGCSSDEAVSTGNALASAMPAIALTSPTALQSTTLALAKPKPSFFATLKKVIGIPTVIAATGGTDQGTMSQQLASNQATLDRSPAEGAAAVSLTFNVVGHASCYGPTLTYAATSYPSGDLGIFAAVEPPLTGTTACAAAEMNQLALNMDPFNQVIKAVGVMLSAGNSSGSGLPGIGESVTISSMPTLGTATVTSATLSRLQNDSEGNAVYKSVLAITIGSNFGTISVQHSPTNSANTTFKGNIQVVLPENGLYMGASMNYINDGTYLTYLAALAHNQTTSSTDFFTSGMVDFSKAAFGQNGYLMLAKFNISTNESTMRFAWSAGKNDAAARVFESQTTASGGLLSGYAYFGFSAGKLSTLTPSTSEWITRFYTNWLGGAVPISSIMQGQTFAQSVANGAFASTGFKGPFVPTNNGTGTGTITGNSLFNGSVTVSTLDFATSGSLGAISAVTVPTFTVQ